MEVATRAIANGVARLADNEGTVRRIVATGSTSPHRTSPRRISPRDSSLPDSSLDHDVEGGAPSETDVESLVEAVHQMRVATRRLRSDLRTFRGALEETWARELRAELERLAKPLGRARDADVLQQRVTAHLRKLGAWERPGAAQLGATLEAQQTSARSALIHELESTRHRELRDRLEQASRDPAAGPAGTRLASEELPRVVSRSWRRLKRRVGSLGKRPSDVELHAVRIAAKRCRYAAEACEPWLGKPAGRMARAAKRLQETLGELNDAIVAGGWLEDWALSAPSVQAAELARELAAVEHAAARRARKRWPKAWERVKAAALD